MPPNPEVLDFRKRGAFNQIDFLIEHGFEIVLLAKNLSEYVPLVQLTVTYVRNALDINISPYITLIDVLEKETSEKRLNSIRVQLDNLARHNFGSINENADQK